MTFSTLSSFFYVVCFLPLVCPQVDGASAAPKDAFIDDLVSEMTVPEMGASLSRYRKSTALGNVIKLLIAEQ